MRFGSHSSTENKTTNLAGGEAHAQSPELALVSILLTSFVKDDYYSSANGTIEQVKKLLDKVEPRFAAQAAMYARTKFGMRSISHVVAGELCKRVSGQPWMKEFLNSVVYRADDILEIVAYYDTRKNKETHAMRKGFGKALTRLNEYELAKYKGDRRSIGMVDVCNMFHPKGNAAISKLMKGELKNIDTWESKLSESGKSDDVSAAKSEAWNSLLEDDKLGYFALLRNLRNIIVQAPTALDTALKMLVDPTKIKGSLVLPFRFVTAMDEITKCGQSHTDTKISSGVRKTLSALSTAFEISVDNCPEFEGETLIAVDESGSMEGEYFRIASIFAAMMYKKNNADLITFSTVARRKIYNPSELLSTLVTNMKKEFANGGTDFKPIFTSLDKAYDRIVIFSDMQAWVGGYCPKFAFSDYKKRTGGDPHLYSIDLAGKGTMQFPERNVYALAGFSEKIFDLMAQLEQDKNALLNEIKKVTFVPAKKEKH